MNRSSAARSRFAFLAALLAALHLLTLTASPASALRVSPPYTAETAICAESERTKEGHAHQRSRDRARAGGPGGGPPPPPAFPGTAPDALLERSARADADTALRRSRPLAAAAPAVLQVFRC
ncbi:hypothetical protein [Streptomyces sp. NPDC014894]|uniref:hypothetical protein n=1 Tax=unclassified Streptomyces TaxID=2593676 RepID=UPI0036F92DC6